MDEAGIIDLSVTEPELPTEMRAFLALGPAGMEAARLAARVGGRRIPLESVRLEAPVREPSKILCVGLNYADHIEEMGHEWPAHPTIFNKQTTCVTGPHGAIHRPRVSERLDYEGELAFVIGRRCRHVPADRADEVIAGYAILNDVSVRDWQQHSLTWTMGKSFDTHGPFGPWLVTPDEIGDPHALGIRTWVNGELRQESNTRHLVHNCFALIAYLSTAFTLLPGDVVSTGTPGGVGVAQSPPRFLRAGDVVRVEVEAIGAIENRVIEEPAETAQIA